MIPEDILYSFVPRGAEQPWLLFAVVMFTLFLVATLQGWFIWRLKEPNSIKIMLFLAAVLFDFVSVKLLLP